MIIPKKSVSSPPTVIVANLGFPNAGRLPNVYLPIGSLGIPLAYPEQSPPPKAVYGRGVSDGRWEMIGSGGYGYVYLTELDGLGEVAVKEVRNQQVDALKGNKIAKEKLFGEEGHASVIVR